MAGRNPRYLLVLLMAASTVTWAADTSLKALKQRLATQAQRIDQLEKMLAEFKTPLSLDCSDYPTNYSFDVYFQGQSRKELVSAIEKAKAAGLTDLFVAYDSHRLYVGRYGPCALAEKRRADVQARTGVPLKIAAIEPRTLQADPTAVRELTVPFIIVGVELRGEQRYLGVASHTPDQPSDISWLLPGQSFGSWQLQKIQAHSATFLVDGQTVVVDFS